MTEQLLSQLSMTLDSMSTSNNIVRSQAENYLKDVN